MLAARLTDILEGRLEGKLDSADPVVPEPVSRLVNSLVLRYLKLVESTALGVPCIEQAHLANLQ